jgi:hypothetical protein
MARAGLVASARQIHQPKIGLWFFLMSRRTLFPSDSDVHWVRRIDHPLNHSQSARLHDSYRQKPTQGQCACVKPFFILTKFPPALPSAQQLNLTEKSGTNSRIARITNK